RGDDAYARLTQAALEMVDAPLVFRFVAFTQLRAGSVDLNHFARLGVLKRQDADIRQLCFAEISHGNGGEVVPLVGQGELAKERVAVLVRGVGEASVRPLQKVADEKGDRPALKHTVHRVERVDNVRS